MHTNSKPCPCIPMPRQADKEAAHETLRFREKSFVGIYRLMIFVSEGSTELDDSAKGLCSRNDHSLCLHIHD